MFSVFAWRKGSVYRKAGGRSDEKDRGVRKKEKNDEKAGTR